MMNDVDFVMFDYNFQLNDLINELLLKIMKIYLHHYYLIVHKMLMQYHHNLYHQDMLLKKGYVVGGSGEFCLIETPSDVDNRLICKSNKKKINIWVKRRNKQI